MKSSTKITIFLVAAFVIIIGITFASRSAVAPDVVPSTDIKPPKEPITTSLAEVSLAEIAQHKTPTDCWTTIKGEVYNLTSFINQHPGGIPNITKLCGIDGTALFMAQHGGQKNPEAQLASLKIGILVK